MTCFPKMTACALALSAMALSAGLAQAGTGAGPERLWLAQSGQETTEGNGGAMQLQNELVIKLREYGIDYPPGQFMTMDQVGRLQNLFNLNEGYASTRDAAMDILGM